MGFLLLEWNGGVSRVPWVFMEGEGVLSGVLPIAVAKDFSTNLSAHKFLANQAKPVQNQFLANQVESAENQSLVTTNIGPTRERQVRGQRAAQDRIVKKDFLTNLST